MPTQRLEEKRVEKCMGEGEREGDGVREGEREKECTHAGEEERERFGSSFYMFLPPPGSALCKLGLAKSAISST